MSNPKMGGNGKSEIKIVSSLDDCILKEDGHIIEVFGPPKSGKTWQIKNLIDSLQENPEFMNLRPNFNYKVLKIDLKSQRSKTNRYSFHRSIAEAHAYNLRRVRLRKKNADVNLNELDLVIADRGPIDDNHWAFALSIEGELSEEQRDSCFALSREAEGLVNAGILVYVSPEEALSRENQIIREKTGHDRRIGSVMNQTSLRNLCELYQLTQVGIPYKEERREIMLARRPVLFVDTTPEGSKEVNAKKIYDYVLQLSVPTTEEYKINGQTA
ncbi:MAG: hypothetical protein KKG75_02595 [Nanoarchaeota archaeon]|nr:hypothetical protein [Nanoarchaeota archaeon]